MKKINGGYVMEINELVVRAKDGDVGALECSMVEIGRAHV